MRSLGEKWFSGKSVSEPCDPLAFPIRDNLEESKCKCRTAERQ